MTHHDLQPNQQLPTRGIAIIESTAPKVGLVCVMPVGTTEISSTRYPDGLEVGSTVTKGDELGRFSFGGSSMCLIFQRGAVDRLAPDNPSSDPDNGGSGLRQRADRPGPVAPRRQQGDLPLDPVVTTQLGEAAETTPGEIRPGVTLGAESASAYTTPFRKKGC
ncbi:phosphatidylserine decarboxylase [Streptomyces sp. UNOC14_S4]|uniref:phosphatidylserine decarboxylase n=1 Tax=Streptomyces sp. UNOC14_S4 TaxID=2872340 RepID=UPI001E2E4755|nr:phosphatidylserine decarboxylase [Streptomyces sp. UNOC14_S4]MCC3770766.1 phosphatidylserine decarboxylase [Streptomyces sp. UNOC14_S4]